MRLVRSWPLKPPDDHPRIFDNCDRVYIPTIDYSPLADLDDDLIHLDWDVAAGQHELRAFAERCLDEPERVRTAPTMSYNTRQRRWQKGSETPSTWMVWHFNDGTRTLLEEGEPTCDLCAFGLIYLPSWTLKGFVKALNEYPEKWGRSRHFGDINFCHWYRTVTAGQGIAVEWDINPVHMNYSIKDTLDGLFTPNDLLLLAL